MHESLSFARARGMTEGEEHCDSKLARLWSVSLRAIQKGTRRGVFGYPPEH